MVNNGFDTKHFIPADPAPIRDRLGLSDDTIAILYPHRPDPDKGLYDALRVVRLLKGRLAAEKFAKVRLLVPMWQDTDLVENSTQTQQTLYPEAQQFAAELGVADKVLLHPWISMLDMPAYYSMGVATSR